MSSYRQIFYQIIFGTKYRAKTLTEEYCLDLYKYIWGILKAKNCITYRINGVEDHIHICCDLHPSVALADLVKDIKLSSSIWLKANPHFPDFIGWQVGYGAFTYSQREKEKIINYVKRQKTHHQEVSFINEFKEILIEQNIEFDEKFLP
ncbi:transposase [Marivirga lumbricoides]|uniref:Transposase n=1 Tax=Marivirga lumbricoides TaxID=1046115 RepID=A0ABQ1N6E2_9BACT|nr:transposase [Marivirga lumbricoides]